MAMSKEIAKQIAETFIGDRAMRVSDLMMGNWVKDLSSGMPIRVNPFNNRIELPDIQPIPITIEMLIDNGFRLESQKYKDRYRRNFDGSRTFVIVDMNQRVIIAQRDTGQEVCHLERRPNEDLYVHELQQAAKIAGISMEFEL